MVDTNTLRGPLLITYPDSLLIQKKKPLASLSQFLEKTKFSSIHLLPFQPYRCDDGFGITDYLRVRPELGTWKNIEAIGKKRIVVADLILNHCSLPNKQFRDEHLLSFTKKPSTTHVFRPRKTPLFVKKNNKFYWTTFSSQQFDLNWKHPHVFTKFQHILDEFAQHSIKGFRLDAVGFTYKDLRTNCFCTKQSQKIAYAFTQYAQKTHGASVIGEVNGTREQIESFLPHCSFIYDFEFTSYLTYSFFYQESTWLYKKTYSSRYLYPASTHDGIPLIPLFQNNLGERFVRDVQKKGFYVSFMNKKKPYELNTTLVSLLGKKATKAAHALAFFLPGVGATFIGNFLLQKNKPGFGRAIHRKKLTSYKVDSDMNTIVSESQNISGSLKLIFVNKKLFVAKRGKYICIINLSDHPVSYDVFGFDVLSKRHIRRLHVQAHEYLWLVKIRFKN
ncbi:MAG: alpha-amylase family glycosyl hydrolase [Candidatus Woesearchaeota archaeon]